MIPLFKSHYSAGKSILTLRPKGDSKANEADSIVDIALDHGLSEVFLVEDNMSGFLEAYTNLSQENIKLNFGLRLIVCNDISDKTAESLPTESKVVIFATNSKAYEALIKINDIAAKEGFYYYPRIDYKNLRAAYESCRDLIFCIPFYDSFIHANVLQNKKCVPQFGNIDPIFMLEDNDLPFDDILAEKVLEYNLNDQPKNIIKVKSCYYKNREDFDAYMTFRCINKRTSLEKPNLDHMCSDEFCFESYTESLEPVSDAYKMGKDRQDAHPNGTKRYYDDPNLEDTIGIAGEIEFAKRYGFKVDDRILPDGDGHIDFTVSKNGKTATIDVKTAQKAYNLLVKEWEIKDCADILVLAEYKDGVVNFLGWETKDVMKDMPVKVFSSLNIKNYYRHHSQLRSMSRLDELLKDAEQIEAK